MIVIVVFKSPTKEALCLCFSVRPQDYSGFLGLCALSGSDSFSTSNLSVSHSPHFTSSLFPPFHFTHSLFPSHPKPRTCFLGSTSSPSKHHLSLVN
ncbi:hypothetical protein VNO78_15193 [Psophocarpus tetragonolobus]|uniref:Uncharacterized protein n=1 Tax=Psophocarpus tetragonolobus TaxID=3891 RepID=A0AAN9SI87_PSOTE